MTEQEALKSALKKVEAQQENLGGFMDRFDIPEHWAVRKALEKQIAKKPMESNFGLMGCPFCLEKVGQRMTKTLYEDLFQYCPTCGQKISWEGVLNR